MKNDPLDHMRGRIEQCRRLAKMITDPQAVEVLLSMAEEGERDLERLLQEREGRSGDSAA